ncbi:delta-sarcoglycan-like [Homalodisca vitripennis]|uniref:delta-sarcoglycan-like n=1 Tax=Homalodisca vitripennis TaxID=197043 RepID=UPI001EEBF7A0|nr:delta-sarcoglycan-like [Homalodisca vitripennis]XP_046681983.1 delta-sarcoglycan-like [Homalodisca vitripennis]
MEPGTPLPTGIYGWRKRCLYALLLGLMVVVLCNLAATLLLLNVSNFNLGGLGDLRIFSGGVFLRDYSYVLGSLVMPRLSSRQGQPLTLESYYNVSLLVRDESGRLGPRGVEQILHFWSDIQDHNRVEVAATAAQLQVTDLGRRALFTAESGGISVGADILRVLEGGVHFAGSVQTSMLRSNLGSELMLESVTRRLFLTGPSGVSLESRAADISASCLTDLHLTSTDGKVKMKAPGIYIPNLESIPLIQPQPFKYGQLKSGTPSRSFQVCMCTNGKLFVSSPDGECRVDNDGVQCR